jgi:hypothetical protein
MTWAFACNQFTRSIVSIDQLEAELSGGLDQGMQITGHHTRTKTISKTARETKQVNFS